VKEIFCGHVPFHSRYVEPAKNKLFKNLNQIMLQKRPCSSKWLTTSSRQTDTFPKLCLAEYYTNYLLSPVQFADAIRLVPEDALMIEVSPPNIIHCVLRDSLYSTVTNIPSYSHLDDVKTLLQAIGDLYNAGLQPQISKLYSTAEFPVSRGTPMISPLIRYAIYTYIICKHKWKKQKKKNLVCISIIVSLEITIQVSLYKIRIHSPAKKTGRQIVTQFFLIFK